MIEWIIDNSIRHRWLVMLATMGLALAGWYALEHTPVDAIPDLSENQVIVFTPWLGHSPREIEDQITFPLSTELQGIEGVVTVRGNSELNFSSIHVVFAESVGVEEARQRVQSRLAQVAGLPAEARPSMAPEAPATGQVFWYAIVAPELDLAQLRSLQDTVVKPQLSTVAGVAEVASVGGFRREFRIAIDPEKVASNRVAWPDLQAALTALGSAPGTRLVAEGGTEIVIEAEPLLHSADGKGSQQQILESLRQVLIPAGVAAGPVRLDEIAQVHASPAARRGVFEMDGVETVGGVVMMRYGGNPLEITERLERRLEQIEAGLPQGVAIVTVYDRVRLIHSALGTVLRTMIEAMLTAALCVVLVLLHFRTSLVIVLTLPLTVLSSFLLLWCLRTVGWFDARTNIMSLAGLVISIGVLVDASVVIAENVMHTLRERFGDRPVRGDISRLVAQACKQVGRATFFSVLIMLLSFFPVFALSGIEGKMFRPLALTKSLALAAAAILSITVVPVLCTLFVRGRLRREEDSWVVRSALEVYRPVLAYLLERPAALAWLLGATFLLGFAPLGLPLAVQAALAVALLATGLLAQSWLGRAAAWVSLVLIALLAQQHIQPLAWERIPPLDEGTAMDMPITLPRISVAQATDDLKMRDMVLCRFPEVEMAMGKAGRADTATDPAPIDMIETMVMFRPHEHWPRRKLTRNDALRQAQAVHRELVRRGIVTGSISADEWNDIVEAVLFRFDAQLREFCYHRNRQCAVDTERELRTFLGRRLLTLLASAGQLARPAELGDAAKLASTFDHRHGGTHAPTWRDFRRHIRAATAEARRLGLVAEDTDVLSKSPSWFSMAVGSAGALLGHSPETIITTLTSNLQAEHNRLWRRHKQQLDRELVGRAAGVYTRLVAEELMRRSPIASEEVERHLADLERARSAPITAAPSGGHHHSAAAPRVARSPQLDAMYAELSESFAGSLVLTTNDRTQLGGFGGEMDAALQMPGWTNVWTRPIQNRVDMLATGINTDIGICVMGERLDDVVTASQAVARVVDEVPGARQVVADPIRGKPYLHVTVDQAAAERRGIPIADIQATLRFALGGEVVAQAVAGRERLRVRMTLVGAGDDAATQLRATQILVGSKRSAAEPTADEAQNLPARLGDVATIAYDDGPTSIKSENGLLRNYVRLNVAERDPAEFISAARQAIAQQVDLPAGVFLQWTGQFEQQKQSWQRLVILVPIVLALIFGLLVWTYHDLADALLVLLALPGALAGGLFMQWLFGTNLSITVLVGYIACFGMAASTGIIMLVYLRDALARSGGLEQTTLAELKAAVMRGAVQRLRPKLLTEATTILAIAPMLWATGIGSEVLRPMAAPVLGGILIADEVIDLFLPVAFYWVRRRRWHRLHSPPAHTTAIEGGPREVPHQTAIEKGLPA